MDCGKKDFYKDIVCWGALYTSTYGNYGTLKDYYENPTAHKATFLTARLPVTPGATLTLSHGLYGKDPRLNDFGYNTASVYDANGTYIGGLGSRNQTKYNVPSNASTIAFSNFIEVLDDYWVLDNTTNEYIFKGKNVI